MTVDLDVRAPLFDRLVDQNHHNRLREGRPKRTLDRQQLRLSVQRELTRLLNSRVQLPLSLLESRERTVVDYGIPDFGSFSARNVDHRKRLALIIERAIEVYEPRLQQVRMILDEPGVDGGVLNGHIEAMLIVDKVAEPISFTTVLQDDAGEVHLHGNS